MNARKEINKLLKEKKGSAKSKEDKEKIRIIEHLLEYEDCFFRIDMEMTVGILEYLGVKNEDLNRIYKELTSPEEYMRLFPKQRTLLEREEKKL